MVRLRIAVAVSIMVLFVGTGTARAITFGQPDGNLHPNVGALLADYDPDSPGPDVLCTGTLIAEKVFLTAGHCTAFLESEGITAVWVTFVPAYDESSTSTAGLFTGTYVTDPLFGTHGLADLHDLAVVLLDRSPGITPAQLPTSGLLDQLQADHALASQTFTAVGYGTARDTKTKGPHGLFFDGVRRYVLQSFLSLQPSWLLLSMNPSAGNGGTCYGDSGGPHFLGGVDSNLIVATTTTGDRWCRATDKDYRLDTASARGFLGRFVTLP
jgi:secreted trypsin-like serine protease